ncbi:ABC transporter ATP-binding protein [Rummeliibacillus stabekisii]|uniref:ABC transporter ATP-binding protein n=1 Tax=Rummeliibacillus stabekisii TaxID=241244 RepID=UPI00116AE82E|nr:ABC transporter ATP-binding protein [Rummeliibacillus stabekisii]MBB5169303.1 ABC-2 type transport system ATP-binding protein [Rummeliibacillus stabekisii]GEL03563.1 putative ABC transporter ATP-binding protein YhcG [Rummeliibacillus stabekisii]
MAVKLSNVSKKYGKEFSLKNVSLTFETGKIYGLLGPNGSGKSTTLKMIAGLVYPNSGKVEVGNEEVSRKISKNVAYLTELDMFYPGFTVANMVDYYATQFTDFDSVKAEELLKEMKLEREKKIKQLSKGTRGRLKLVLALSRNAPVLLLDEPFSGLDPMVRDSIVKSLLSYINFDLQTMIIATHEIDEIEPLLDEAIVIFHGNIIGQKNVEELREEEGLSVLDWFKDTAKNMEAKMNG